MTALVLCDPFFAPVDKTRLCHLLEDHQRERARIAQLAASVTGEDSKKTLAYFLSGNTRRDRGVTPEVEQLLNPAGAIAALNADYWSQALALTDVFQCLPEKRRREWTDAIHDMTTPDFTEDAVIPTLEQLLMDRGKYFAERVANVWSELSPYHKTNQANGYSKRFIFSYVFTETGYVNSQRAGTIHDLRAVISKFMGTTAPPWHTTSNDLTRCMRRPGEWHNIDGGGLRIRVYRGTGTAHIEVHPDLALRLNSVLASIYPHAIPARERTQIKGAVKSYTVLQRPLPGAVIDQLRHVRVTRENGRHLARMGYENAEDRFARAEACRALEMIGGVREGRDAFAFDYNPEDVVDEIVLSGTLPDQRSHQYYPTPASIAARVVAAAQIGPTHTCLEPSAGQGGIADYLPKDRTTCVELSALHCQVLRAKGHTVEHADFLVWAQNNPNRFDCIVMNPPFAGKQWREHVDAATRLLATGGRLVAVVPASAVNAKIATPGFTQDWSEPITGEFEHTNIAVAILTLVPEALQKAA